MTLTQLTSVTDADELRRRTLWAIPTPLGVLGTLSGDEQPHLMNVSWVTPVANDPTRLVVSVESASVSAANLRACPMWTLTLLDVEDRALGRAFVKPDRTWVHDERGERVDDHEIARSTAGVPYVLAGVAAFGGHAELLRELGDHELWLCELTEVALSDDALDGPASEHRVKILGVHDTRMNYGR